MYEELYEPLPDVDAYLKRIGFTGTPKVNLTTLEQLIYLHQTAIPFEDIDVHCRKVPITLAIRELFDKIILGGRGGYCFELNCLFYSLLQALGFTVTPCICKVLEGEGPHFIASHRGTIVHLNADCYYCDVGFGGPVPPGPLKFENSTLQTIGPNRYQFIKCDNSWWELVRINSKIEPVSMLLVNTEPFDPVDYLSMNMICSDHNSRHHNRFTDHLVLNIRTADGHASIEDDVFTLRIGEKTIRETIDDARAHKLCRDVFCISADLSSIRLIP
ncbi:arylamine N-acetyltransferase family protein [Eubacterium oxidoreducens]|uniref:N-hydroxyarylamine O-acetyltransferase n=1 Tax=Eubacterium oxidoreducens TaxID=1732 RepID=A0A1G6AAG3_EUBOX|nr:arylamine N-acetyltransferase [Eubacterium oxidoreducens]SDB05369.1 N-hydroxyarylamine O-acetyltransferase [Eubacterium oxidoreducens]